MKWQMSLRWDLGGAEPMTDCVKQSTAWAENQKTTKASGHLHSFLKDFVYVLRGCRCFNFLLVYPQR